MALTLDIGKLAAARQAIGSSSAATVFYLCVECILLIEIAIKSSWHALSVLSFFGLLSLTAAQVFLVRHGAKHLVVRGGAYQVVVLLLLFFGGTGIVLHDEVWFFYPWLLMYPIVRGLRGITLIRRERQATIEPAALEGWLFGGRHHLPQPGDFPVHWARALPWFISSVLFAPAALFVSYKWNPLHTQIGGSLFGLALLGSGFLFVIGRRAMKRTAAEVKLYDQRPVVLILRAFADDKIKVRGVAWPGGPFGYCEAGRGVRWRS